jgi:DNA-binding winged helix-turn-helix (wHTH) protein
MPTPALDIARLAASGACLRLGDGLELDLAAATLHRNGHPVPLRAQTWRLLCLLAANAGCLCSHEELSAALWPRAVVCRDSLVQCVVELRRALGDRERRLLRTVPRLGYRLDAEVDVGIGTEAAIAAPAQSPSHDPLAPLWQALAQADELAEVRRLRAAFEAASGDAALRADALAGLAMSHVVETLNRWSPCPAWNIALAREAADEAVARAPQCARSCHARAHDALLQGQHMEALLGFRAALRRDPRMARARLRIGVIEMELGHPERTALHVRQALAGGGDDEGLRAQADFIQGMACFHLGRDDEARERLRGVLQVRPRNGMAHQWMSALDALQGREASSADHLAAFCSHVPGHSIESLRATERSHDTVFVQQRARFYEGLRRAGLP